MSSVNVSELMRILSAELRQLAEATENLHDVVFAEGEIKGDGVRVVQSIDRTQQTLENLADFMSVLGEDMSENLAVAMENALAQVRLADLKRRLNMDGSSPFESKALADAGDLELFG